MKYSDFLKKMSEVQVGVTLRDEEEAVYKKLLPEITIPQFWSEINDLSGVTLIQGQAFYSPPRYERYEQFLCSVDGYVQVKLIPHVYRQEVYAGKDRIITDSDIKDEGS